MVGRHLQGQPGLADAAGPDERQEPRGPEQPPHLTPLALAPDEAGRLQRQVVLPPPSSPEWAWRQLALAVRRCAGLPFGQAGGDCLQAHLAELGRSSQVGLVEPATPPSVRIPVPARLLALAARGERDQTVLNAE